MQLRDLLDSEYSHNGHGPRHYNCWGLVRAGLTGLFGVPCLPEFGHIQPDDKAALTAAWSQIKAGWRQCTPAPGAMACWYEGAALVHVGLVIERAGRVLVLHINEGTGPVQTPLRQAARLAQRIEFWRWEGA